MLKKSKIIFGVVAGCACNVAIANVWTDLPQVHSQDTSKKVLKHRALEADITQLRQLLDISENQQQTIDLPTPDGKSVRFVISPDSIMAPELAKKYPEIMTFKGYQVGNPNNKGRFDITPQGFHAMFRGPDGELVYIDPFDVETDKEYKSYHYRNAPQRDFTDRVLGELPAREGERQARTAGEMRKFRLAVATSGEYTRYHGGSVIRGMSAVTTAINRVNQIYQQDLSIKLELIANNDQLIFTNPSSDPFSNTVNDIDVNAGVLNERVGISAYDIGHIFNTQGGGLASLGGVCGSRKADGLTGARYPEGDAFHVDYVAHEIGHQFGAEHTFNGTQGNCSGGNRSYNSAYEPGSGTTVMAYAGICGDDDLQSNSDPYFHSHSIDQINDFLFRDDDCSTKVFASNSNPVVDAGADYTIPARTPFILEGSATDANNDSLSYNWEQYDLGRANSNLSTDLGSGPLFRVWPLSSQPVRYLPRLEDVFNDTTAYGETYPTTSRRLNFRLIARDGKGGVGMDETRITVQSSLGFRITSPSTEVSWNAGSQQSITWNVANTAQSPISCSKVDISIWPDIESTPIVVKEGTPNDGTELITVPGRSASNGRIMVRCSDNIFYAVTDKALTINTSNFNLPPVISGQKNTPEIVAGQSLSVTLNDLQVVDTDNDYPGDFTLEILPGETYSVSGNQITFNEGLTGEYTVSVKVNDGKSDSNTYQYNVVIKTVVVDPIEITGQQSIEVVSGKSVTLTLGQLQISGLEQGKTYTLTIGEGENYTVSGNTITADEAFTGFLSVPVTVSGNEQPSANFTMQVSVTADTGPTTIGGDDESGGGSLPVWALALMLVPLLRRKQ